MSINLEEMATPSALSFHEDSRRLFRDVAMNKVKYKDHRWSLNTYDRAFKGFPKTSTGSWNVPMGYSLNDNNKPFNPIPGAMAQGARLRGGIRDNANYPKVQKLLKQRARDMDWQDNPAIPEPILAESLTDSDKYKIKLNALLIRLDDLMETGTRELATEDIWREIIILTANLAPTMTSEELNEMLDYWQNMVGDTALDIMAKGNAINMIKKGPFVRERISASIFRFIKEMIGKQYQSIQERQQLARAWVRSSGYATLANKVLKEAREYADDWIATMGDGSFFGLREPILGDYREMDDGGVGDYVPPRLPVGAPVGEEEEADAEEEDEDEVDDEEEAVAAPAVVAGLSLAKRQFNYLYNRSPKGKGAASDALMELFLIAHPRSRTDKSRAQVKNDIYYRLDGDGAMANALKAKLAELAPGVA